MTGYPRRDSLQFLTPSDTALEWLYSKAEPREG